MVDSEGTASRQIKRDTRKHTGQIGEAAACVYLTEANYTIVDRNWRCRSGEIDIIAERDGRLIFVEVRARKAGGRFGTAAESVDRRKQQKLRDTAQVYLRSVGRSNASVRFDVIAISMNGMDESIVECKHFESAF